MTQVPRSVPRTSDGIEIIAVERAHGPHPNPVHRGLIVPYSFVDELLLADGTTRYRCTKPTEDGSICNRDTFTSVRSAVGHMPAHNPGKHDPDYPESTLRLLIRLVKTEEMQGKHSGKLERVAAELNRRGVPTLSGNPWLATNVGALYHDHKGRYRVRVHLPKTDSTVSTPSEDAAVTASTPNPATVSSRLTRRPGIADLNGGSAPDLLELDARGRKLTARANDLVKAVNTLAGDLEEFQRGVAAALVRVAATSQPDPEVLEKARNYDAIKGLLS